MGKLQLPRLKRWFGRLQTSLMTTIRGQLLCGQRAQLTHVEEVHTAVISREWRRKTSGAELMDGIAPGESVVRKDSRVELSQYCLPVGMWYFLLPVESKVEWTKRKLPNSDSCRSPLLSTLVVMELARYSSDSGSRGWWAPGIGPEKARQTSGGVGHRVCGESSRTQTAVVRVRSEVGAEKLHSAS